MRQHRSLNSHPIKPRVCECFLFARLRIRTVEHFESDASDLQPALDKFRTLLDRNTGKIDQFVFVLLVDLPKLVLKRPAPG